MSERRLKNRKRKPDAGKVIRISTPVWTKLQDIRLNRRRISWDNFFRKMFGLPDRSGNAQPLIEGYLEVTSGKFFLVTPLIKHQATLKEAEKSAYELAIKLAPGPHSVRKPIRMREYA